MDQTGAPEWAPDDLWWPDAPICTACGDLTWPIPTGWRCVRCAIRWDEDGANGRHETTGR